MNYIKKKRFINRILFFIISEFLFLFAFLFVQNSYCEIDLDNIRQLNCKIDDIYISNPMSRHSHYCVVIDDEIYKLHWHSNRPKGIKDVKDDHTYSRAKKFACKNTAGRNEYI